MSYSIALNCFEKFNFLHMYIEILKQDACSVVCYLILLGSDCALLLKYAMSILERGRL